MINKTNSNDGNEGEMSTHSAQKLSMINISLSITSYKEYKITIVFEGSNKL